MIITGRGLSSVIAREGSLKIKEVTYIQAEAFPGGEFKHGPLALIGPDKAIPIIYIILNDRNFELDINTLG
jgi:glucosamine--fructose-6-phosphate aminotransferase (isomerizing)